MQEDYQLLRDVEGRNLVLEVRLPDPIARLVSRVTIMICHT